MLAATMAALACSSARDAGPDGGPGRDVAAQVGGDGEPSPGGSAVSTTVHLVLFAGQSNMSGADPRDPPSGVPNPAIPFWHNDYYYGNGDHAWDPLHLDPHNGNYSHEISTLQAMHAAGLRVGGIKLVKGATYLSQWLPTESTGRPGHYFYDELSEALAAAPVAFEGAVEWRIYFVWDQGESEARTPTLSIAEAWSEQYEQMVALLQARADAFYAALDLPARPMARVVVRTGSNIAKKTFPGALEDEQASVVDDAHLIDTNDAEMRPDNLHRMGTWQSYMGRERVARILLEDARGE